MRKHSQQEPEGGPMEAGSSAPKRLQGWRSEMAGREAGWRPQLHQLSGQLLPSSPGEGPRRMYPQTRPSGHAGICFDFHLRYPGEPWYYSPQTNQQVDSTKSPPGHSSQVSICVTQRHQLLRGCLFSVTELLLHAGSPGTQHRQLIH